MEESNMELSNLQPPTKKPKNEEGDIHEDQDLRKEGDIHEDLGKKEDIDEDLVKETEQDETETFTKYREEDFYSSSDEDWTNEDFRAYMDTVAKSEYFYIPDVPEGVKVSALRPAPVRDLDWLTTVADAALRWYNDNGMDKEKYKLPTAKHGSQTCRGGILYYVAFTALGEDTLGEDSPRQEFRAKVLYAVGNRFLVESFEKLTPDGWLASHVVLMESD